MPGGGRPALQVTTECDTTSLGNFHQLIRRPFEPPIDVLACAPWGRLDLSDEDYGTDEEFLPPFYLLKLLFDRRDAWVFPEAVANDIKGPLTVTVISVNLLGAEGSFHAARDFERRMKEKNVAHHVSTQFFIPGILAAVTSAEPTEPHQVLIASQTFEREPVPNAEYGSVRD